MPALAFAGICRDMFVCLVGILCVMLNECNDAGLNESDILGCLVYHSTSLVYHSTYPVYHSTSLAYHSTSLVYHLTSLVYYSTSFALVWAVGPFY